MSSFCGDHPMPGHSNRPTFSSHFAETKTNTVDLDITEHDLDYIEPNRNLRARLRSRARPIGALVAAATVSAVALFGLNLYRSNETHQTNIEQQQALGRTVNPLLNKVGHLMITSKTNWDSLHPGNKDAYKETTLTGNKVAITATNTNSEVIMDTKLVNGVVEPNPNKTIYASLGIVDTGDFVNQFTGGSQYTFARPVGIRYVPDSVPLNDIVEGDWFAGITTGQKDGGGFTESEDTTDLIDGIDNIYSWKDPAQVARDIYGFQGLREVIRKWEQTPQFVNSTDVWTGQQ